MESSPPTTRAAWLDLTSIRSTRTRTRCYQAPTAPPTAPLGLGWSRHVGHRAVGGALHLDSGDGTPVPLAGLLVALHAVCLRGGAAVRLPSFSAGGPAGPRDPTEGHTHVGPGAVLRDLHRRGRARRDSDWHARGGPG